MERGFKSRCESISLGQRKELGLSPIDPLPPEDLAEYLQVPVVTLHDILGLDETDIHQLLVVDPDA